MIIRRFLLALALLLGAISSGNAAARFLVACTTACTWDNSSTAIWSTTTGGAPGSSAPGSADTVTLDANSCVGGLTCTITVNANLTLSSLTMGACTASTTGCILDFSANNNNVTLSAAASFSGTGTGTRTLNMGNGTWTLTPSGGGNPWNMSTTTNLTFNANGSTIVYSATATVSRNFIGGGLTYNNFSLGANSSLGLTSITGTNTFAGISVTAPNALGFPSGVTTTITNAFTLTGSSGSELMVTSAALGTQATVSTASGTPTMSWAGVRDMVFTGGATFSATNSFDLGRNSGITITAPSGGGGGFIIGG